ncbi:hypothetical protein WJX84_008348 [Apatococcus fuscideae]|uniref:Uncharacterized protein n=1 Tax=Apatococcus fuscideae TaxID=2026836 RepID=A0AAW1T2Y7_9CHLO
MAATLTQEGCESVSELQAWQDGQLAAALAREEQLKAHQLQAASEEQELRQMNSFLLEELQARLQAESGAGASGRASSDPHH